MRVVLCDGAVSGIPFAKGREGESRCLVRTGESGGAGGTHLPQKLRPVSSKQAFHHARKLPD